jgi:UPF0042 nucleotide-binding protein
MPDISQPLLIVTGLAGAGKTTALKVLEDLGWEVVDNLPVSLLDDLLLAPRSRGSTERPLAVGVDSRSRGFRPAALVRALKQMREEQARDVSVLFLDCAGTELERRFTENRRRHPMADDRPVADGIARERELLESLRRWAEHVVDTTNYSSNDLQHEIRRRFAIGELSEPVLTVMSFGFSRGLPRNADLVFDMRFLNNPYWVPALRRKTGQDPDVAAYVAADPAYAEAVGQIETLLLTVLPRYAVEGKSYVTVAIGCTGGRHRSVHVAERVAATLEAHGHKPVVTHRNLDSAPQDGLEGAPPNAKRAGGERK